MPSAASFYMFATVLLENPRSVSEDKPISRAVDVGFFSVEHVQYIAELHYYNSENRSFEDDQGYFTILAKVRINVLLTSPNSQLNCVAHKL
jgi:hypothetical protein